MVTDYHLLRDAQLRATESLDRRDEIDRLITFKEWLRAYEWDTDPARLGYEQATADLDTPDPRNTDQDADWDTVWGNNRRVPAVEDAVPRQRTQVAEDDPVAGAHRAVAAIPAPNPDRDSDRARADDGWLLPPVAVHANNVDNADRGDELTAAGSYR
jgi:hypothetical protein